MTDEQLVVLCRSGDGAAWEELYKKYKPRVLSVARRFFLSGGETEDLVQEGMCGLYFAVCGFKEGGASFSSYAYSCIKNRILDTVKKSGGAKYSALNNFLPIDTGEEIYLSGENPEEQIIGVENGRELLQKMSKILSSLEFKSLVMYTDGMTLSEISSALDKGPKSVDNALTRAKHKLQKSISAEE
ncbi:MAG: sigma-70 family RNA polymerase sigma factor [Clostridia bacterium]|nr:sigma-70 family RNA polymerase sigma factor [Clostridia bacterium]